MRRAEVVLVERRQAPTEAASPLMVARRTEAPKRPTRRSLPRLLVERQERKETRSLRIHRSTAAVVVAV
jgi:hypothetical protein